MKHLIFLLSFLILLNTIYSDTACSHRLKIHDDERLTNILHSVRELFLSKRPKPYDKVDMTLLIPNEDGSWLRAGVEQNRLTYPASTVKLPYLVASVHWCLTNNKAYNCLDDHNRPMIYTSDNFETGVVVDFITGAPNYDTNKNDSTFYEWIQKRNYTARFLNSRGLLENQVILHKTYPSNSGNPNGAEHLAREIYGQNLMNPKCASSLLAEIVSGELLPEARDYFLGILFHTRYSYSSLGSGLPPGSILYTKIGNAYDILAEVAYVRLPNGKRFIIAVYTNGYDPTQPYTYSLSWLSELIIEKTGLCIGCPKKQIFDISHPNFYTTGKWQLSNSRDSYGNSFFYSNDMSARAGWSFSVNETSLYEVSFWNPQNNDFCKTTKISINHDGGTSTILKDQTINGGSFIKLGDFDFTKNKNYKIEISNNCNGKGIAIDSLRLIKWPNCGNIPGTPCLHDNM